MGANSWVMLGMSVASILLGCAAARGDERRPPAPPETVEGPPVGEKLERSQAEWRRRLTPAQFHVMREQGTERAFTGTYWNHHAAGIYRCAACGAPLFSSRTKFESGTGLPSFWQPIEGRVAQASDESLGMVRNEVHCARCGGHLGHVFDDGPEPTGLRYCINSVALAFRAASDAAH